MLTRLKRLLRLPAAKKELMYYNNERLGPLSVVLLITLDLFLLTAVYTGIGAEEAKSPTATQHYPKTCVSHFQEPRSDHLRMTAYFSKESASPLCRELKRHLRDLQDNPSFSETKEELSRLGAAISGVEKELKKIRANYNTRLFEKIAKESDGAELYRMKLAYESYQEELAELERAEAALPELPAFKEYGAYLEFVKSNREAFFEARDDYAFWQPFYSFGRMLSFVLPLFLLALLIHRTLRRPLASLISSHLLLILSIPLVLDSLYLIYHVLPKTLLADLLRLFDALGLVILFQYLLIAGLIALFGGAIYLAQKRLATRRKTSGPDIHRTISYSRCSGCGHQVDYTHAYCPHCANRLLAPCPHCNEATIRQLPYCRCCGAEKSTSKEA